MWRGTRAVAARARLALAAVGLRGGDTRRRAAPFWNPRPAHPAPPAIRPFARRKELEPQPPACGRRALALARTRCSPSPCGRA
eukprot:2700078-Prymnesium_polylepis.1